MRWAFLILFAACLHRAIVGTGAPPCADFPPAVISTEPINLEAIDFTHPSGFQITTCDGRQLLLRSDEPLGLTWNFERACVEAHCR